MAGITCVEDIDAAGRRQYGANLLVTRNGQATVRGDLTPRCSEAAIVSGDPSTHTISHGTMWQSNVTWHSSNHQHYHWLFLARVSL
jgi:hypothetical protein